MSNVHDQMATGDSCGAWMKMNRAVMPCIIPRVTEVLCPERSTGMQRSIELLQP